jgi:hypothetical protein
MTEWPCVAVNRGSLTRRVIHVDSDCRKLAEAASCRPARPVKLRECDVCAVCADGGPDRSGHTRAHQRALKEAAND